MPRSKPSFTPLLVVALAVLFPRLVAAEPIISNGGSLNTSGTDAAIVSGAVSTSYIAAGFTINAGSTYTFTDAIAYGILNMGGSAGGTSYATGSLWMGTGSGPTTFVENLTVASSLQSNNVYTYTFDDTTGATLIGGDTYWLVITPIKKTFEWYTSTQTSTGPGATYVGAGQGTLSGTMSSPSVVNYSNGPGGFAGFEIDATSTLASVPEPSSLAMCGLAGVIGSAYAWRRRQRAATA